MANSRFKIALVYFKSVPSFTEYVSEEFLDEQSVLDYLKRNKKFISTQTRFVIDFGEDWLKIDPNVSGKLIYIEIEDKIIKL